MLREKFWTRFSNGRKITPNVIREEKHGGLFHECRRNNKAPWESLGAV